MKIYNYFMRRKGEPAPTGDGFEYVNEEFTDEKTGEIFIKVNKIPVYEMIQAARETTDMTYILAQLAKGDTTVLERTHGVYLDSTELPQSLEEALAFNEKIDNVYNSNDILKDIYKNKEDYKKALLNGEDIISKVNDYHNQKIFALKNKQNEIKKEVKTNETESK